jgi:RNA polymerase sigma-70 factor (ECF subfamily)
MEADRITSRLLRQRAEGSEGGCRQADNELIARACRRLGPLAQRMLGRSRVARRWEQWEDLLQEALRRMHRALRSMSFESSSHFWNTANRHLRFALRDLARRHGGPEGQGAHHHTDHGRRAADDPGQPLHVQPDGSDVRSLDEWAEFHEAVESLPEESRTLFDLLYYQEVPQEEAARQLGLPLRTLKHRWHRARGEMGKRLRERHHRH